MIRPVDYCVLCGEEALVSLGDDPLCVSHFADVMHQFNSDA